MKRRDWLFWVLLALALGTLATGLIQMVVPRFVLGIVGATVTAPAPYLFTIIGMFMALFGGLVAHALWDTAHHPLAVFWGGLQKLGAAVAVTLGFTGDVFTTLALGIAGLDLLTGVLLLMYWRRIRGE